MYKRMIALFAVALMACSLLVGCKSQTPAQEAAAPAGSAATTEAAAEAPADINETGTLKLRWHQRCGIDTLFECPMDDCQSLYPYMVFDPLVSMSGKDGNIVPKLATEYAVSDDGLTYTFTIRDGVTWQDGTPFTAADVAFTFWANVADPNAAVCKSMMTNIVGASDVTDNAATSLSGVVVDGNKVSVTLTAPNRSFLNFVAMMYILPADKLAGVDPANISTCDFWTKPIGTGAYVIDQVSFPDYFTCERNDAYWGDKAGIKNVLFTNYTTGGDDAVVAALIAGDLDFAYGNTLNDITVASNVSAQNSDVESVVMPSNYCRYFVFNEVGASDGQGNPGMKDVKVRQAISMLVDREAIAGLYAGQAEVRTTFIPNSHPMYNDDIAPFQRDVEGAKQLLTDAGFDFTKKIRICYYYDDQTTVDAMDLVCQNLADAGIQAEAFLATGDLGSILYTVHNYDMLYCGWVKDDPVNIYIEVMADGGEEPIQDGHDYRQVNFTDKLNAYNAATDNATAKQIADEIQAAGVESCYFFPVYGLNNIEMVNKAHVSIPEVVQEYGYQYNRDYKFSEWSLVG